MIAGLARPVLCPGGVHSAQRARNQASQAESELVWRQKIDESFQCSHVMLKSRSGGLPRLMDVKCSIWLPNSAWRVLGHQIKLGAGHRVLKPRRIDLFSQKLQNLSVVGVIGHFVYRNQSYSCKSPKAKGKAIVSGFRGINHIRRFFAFRVTLFPWQRSGSR
jgi:hypothetical protein